MDRAFSAAQVIFPSFRFGSDDPAEAARWVELGVGGFCLYGGRPEEIRSFTARMAAKSGIRLIFCADYENGVGQWVEGGTLFPSNMAVGAAGSTDFACRKGIATAREARCLGVDWILAPVVDLATCPENPIVNLRSFGASVETVRGLAGGYLDGLEAGGALNCLKHFPGHGESRRDSHLELPVLSLTKEKIEMREAVPYRDLQKRADAIMVAHLKIPALDDKHPTSLSGNVITGFLREEIGYAGVVVTDALSMQAVGPDPEAGVLALQAGADILLGPQDPFRLHRALLNRLDSGRIRIENVERAAARVDALRAKAQRAVSEDPSLLGCREHREWAREIAEKAVASVGNRPPQTPEPGEEIFYWEPQAGGEPDWQGRFFIEILRREGWKISPYRNGIRKNLIVGLFLRPQAYSGKIVLDPKKRHNVEKALAACQSRILVSFGSPFALRGFDFDAGLCTFSDIPDSQRAAARVLLGKIKAQGAWPVDV